MSERPQVAVIIPFFQRESGLLRNALKSALSQAGSFDLDVIVVDDSSPAPAEPELAGLPTEGARRVRLMRQRNGGAGAARNTALQHLTPGTEFVAFLDSDDVWTDDHVSRALRAMGESLDFYFSNFRRFDQAVGVFESMGYDPPRREIGEALYKHEGRIIDDFLLSKPIQTSTIVVRASIIGDSRFQVDLRHAHEDHLFFIEITEQARGAALSWKQECLCGDGVGINYRSSKPESPSAPAFALDIVRYLKLVERRSDLSAPIVKHLKSSRKQALTLAAWHLAHCVQTRRLPAGRTYLKLIASDARVGPLLAAAAGRILVQKLARR